MLVLLALAAPASAQESTFRPEVGQAGKDVVWVPTPAAVVEKMLDLAQVTQSDYVIDLGSGDAQCHRCGEARRGRARCRIQPGHGHALEAPGQGSWRRRQGAVRQGDMFVADISKANVMALSSSEQWAEAARGFSSFARVLASSDTFNIQDWQADETVTVDNCSRRAPPCCTSCPRRSAGTWKSDSTCWAQAGISDAVRDDDLRRPADSSVRVPERLRSHTQGG